jgi:pyroglutamyl-peptidase
LPPTDERSVILLTGFGPFPGVPENATARLVPRLASAARDLFPAYDVVAEILPTEWAAAPQRLADLLARSGPVLALHFGVTRHAEGFRIELVGRNECKQTEDAGGCLPASGVLIEDGPPKLGCTLPAERIVDRLVRLGVPATTSEDAGGFLCNALLYHSLAAARALETPRLAGFVHLPIDLPERNAAQDRRLDMRGAIAGGLEIIAECLDAIGSLTPVKTG